MPKTTDNDISQQSRQNKHYLTFPSAASHGNLKPMSETQFTALDWRPGKKRKTYVRQRRYNGQKQAPAAFLAAAAVSGIGSGKHRLCGARRRDGGICRDIAMRGCDHCRAHGGASQTARLIRPYVRSRDGAVIIPKARPNLEP